VSTIAVDNARPSAGGTSYSLTSGVAKARAVINMKTASLLESENITSITDEGAGYFTHSFTDNMNTSSYSFVGAGKFDTSNVNAEVPTIGLRRTSAANSTSSYAISSITTDTAAANDCEYVSSIVVGDLA